MKYLTGNSFGRSRRPFIVKLSPSGKTLSKGPLYDLAEYVNIYYDGSLSYGRTAIKSGVAGVIKMQAQTIEYKRIPVKPTICPVKPEQYGTVEGLDNDELADPSELERIGYLRLYAPVLTLPRLDSDPIFSPEFAGGAFDTWDFHRMYPCMAETARRQSRLNWLKSKLRDRLIILSILKDKLSVSQRALAITAARKSSDFESLPDPETQAFAREYKRSLVIRNQIAGHKRQYSSAS